MKSKAIHPKKSAVLIKNLHQFPVIGIGASAGGLDAFKKLLKAISENSGMAYILVQHLDPKHESMLPELLQKVTNISVMEISDELKVMPNHIYIIPSNKMMIAKDGVLVLTPRETKNKNERNLPIDVFFTSLAEVYQSHAIGVILSGTASDGTLGLKAIKDHGGITFAQDEASAAYEGMPHSAAEAGVVDFILPPEQIPQKLLEVTHITNGKELSDENTPIEGVDAFKQMLSLLRIRKGTDFTYYKQTTIRRRILRRMAINKNEKPITYLNYLRENKTEQDILYQDLLIPVTSFFRDPKIFDHLCESIFPIIAKNKNVNESIRIWIAGCSTGEEAYSIAICLKEFIRDNDYSFSGDRIQIFATDISEPAIEKARSGLYTKNNTEGISIQRLQEFFTKTNAGYQVNKSIRDMCVFAVHNFLKDPPFGKMDFISCRNVLIYMEPYLQKKALHIFHYSLNTKGFILLGKSETTNGTPELFTNVGKSDKLFSRKDVHTRLMNATSMRSEKSYTEMNTNQKSAQTKPDFQKTADDIILSKYTPAGVVVNESMDIVHFRGNTSKYLQQFAGKPSHNLYKMAKEGLAFELRNILHKTKKDHVPVSKENISIQDNGKQQLITIEALLLPDTIEPHYLILFHDSNSDGMQHSAFTHNKLSANKIKRDEKGLRIQQLEKELALIREDMRSITEDQEASNEELQSSNEELLSGSEELQSLNEELETGKEELQSTNEELMVVNQEMISLNEQVSAARDYAEAIISNIREPLLVMDKNLRIRTANEAFYKTFRVNKKETEAVLIYELGNHQWDIPALRNLLEKILPDKSVFDGFEVNHTFSSIGERVMLLNAREVVSKIDSEKLILLSIEDVTEQVSSRKIMKLSELRYIKLIQNLPIAVYTCDKNGYIDLFNIAAVKLWGRTPDLGKDRWCGSYKLYHLDGTFIPVDQCPMAIIFQEKHIVKEIEMIIERKDKTSSTVIPHPLPVFDEKGILTGTVNTLIDITEIRKTQQELKEKDLQLQLQIKENQQKLTIEMEEKLQQNTLDLSLASASILLKNKEIDLNNYNKRFLTAFNENFFDYKLDYEFFSALTQFIVNTTKLDYAYIGKLVNDDTNKLAIQTIAFNAFGESTTNFTYPFEDSPDEQIMRGVIYSYPNNCSNLFKTNETILSHKIEGYIGYPLNDDQGNAVGLIALMHRKEIEDDESILSILKIVAKRTEIVLERVKNEEQLVSYNEQLKEKNTELLKINKELEAFTYVSSHDLQEPLRKIQTFANRILEKENENLSPSGKDYFNRMQSAASRMQSLIEDLLAFTRINTAERKFEKMDLEYILKDVISEFKEMIDEKKAIIETHVLGEVNIIPFQFRQLLQNLIGNALKFSKPGIPPHISIRSKLIQSNEIISPLLLTNKQYHHISFEDQGIGFEPEYREKIFEVFQRLHGKEKYQGTGIGLAIVKKIIENHLGYISANGILNIGAIFDIYIPVS